MDFIISKNLGAEATEANLKKLELEKTKAAALAQEKREKAIELQKALEEAKILIYNKTKDSKFFGRITPKDIAQAIKEQHGLDVDPKKFVSSDPIKDIGNYIINIKLDSGIIARVVLEARGEEV